MGVLIIVLDQVMISEEDFREQTDAQFFLSKVRPERLEELVGGRFREHEAELSLDKGHRTLKPGARALALDSPGQHS